MGGCVLSTESDGAYITYTDGDGETVKKKLGSGKITIPIFSNYISSSSGSGHGAAELKINTDGRSKLTFTVSDPGYKYWTEMNCWGYYSDGSYKNLMNRTYSSNNSYGTIDYEFDISQFTYIRFHISITTTASPSPSAHFANIVME